MSYAGSRLALIHPASLFHQAYGSPFNGAQRKAVRNSAGLTTGNGAAMRTLALRTCLAFHVMR